MNRIDGSTASDIIFGSELSDWIYSYEGFDLVHGGLGKDIYTPGADGELKMFRDFEDGSDLIDLRGWGVSRFDQLVITEVEPGKTKVSTADGSHYVYVSPMDDGDVVTIDATDFIYSGTKLHDYTTGNDEVAVKVNEYAVHFGNGGTNTLNLGALIRGAETATATAVVTMDAGGQGNGTFTVKGVTQHFFDFQNIRGTSGQDTLIGDDQDNSLSGMNNGDELRGEGGNDQLSGDRGADVLYGGDGDDVLDGGDGYDQSTGGAGADRFVFTSADTRQDLVRDYQNGTDILDIRQWGGDDISDLTITDLGSGRVNVALTGGSLGFELRSGGEPLTLADLDNGDFVFV